MNGGQDICGKLDEITSRLDGLAKSQASIHKCLSTLKSHLSGSARAEKQADGPIPPDKLRLGGIVYESFTALEWRVVESLWGQDAVEAVALCDHIYGHDHDDKKIAVDSLIKRINRKFRKKSVSAKVVARNGSFFLKFWKGQKRVGDGPRQTPCA